MKRIRWVLLASIVSFPFVSACGGDDAPIETDSGAGDGEMPFDGDVGDAGDDGGDGGGRDAGPPRCGNEELEGDEVCDDANNVDGDGCSANCLSLERCGNAYVDAPIGETCDDGNTNNGDGCSADCLSDETCGNGIVDIGVGEVCDDGNTTGGDGCSADCRAGAICGDGTTEGAEVCDDGNTVGGDGCSADCLSDESCGNGVLDSGEQCDDGNTAAADGCSATCTTERCGNSTVDPGEDCDDGNGSDGDGCDNDCTYSCTTATECDDGEACTGVESCNTTSHTCAAGTPPAEGSTCATGMVCRGGACVATVCGNGMVEGAEQCDDGNVADGDGCEGDCTWTCTAAADCDDGNACNGAETCNTTTHLCAAGTPPAAGTSCGGGLVCRGGACVAPVCGNSLVEGTEQCDDGNGADGDGCDNDCTYSCTTSTECSDGAVCNGAETCNTTTHACQAGTPATDGTSCGGMGRICRAGTCVRPACGDGFVEGTEQCDDGNGTDGDGCDNDCTYSCSAAADCGDGNVCNGAESCNTTTHVCQAGTPPADGTSCGTGRVCRAGSCAVTACGNGFREGTEECDDGNSTNGDGCQNDCTWTCETNAECADSNSCNGSETCNVSTHTCSAGTPAANGTLCDRDMNPGTRDICRSASCVASTCGDGYVDTGAGEECDDGNATDGDGCQSTCVWTCETNAECSDGRVCNGSETCNTTTHLCAAGTPAANGTVCDRDMNPGTRDICQMASCVASTCGDGYVDTGAGEECEDGNTVNGDGCESTCVWTCETNAECSDGRVCNGAETCNVSTHRCSAGTAAADGTTCDRDMNPGTRDICRMASCVASTCGDGYVDTGGGEECEDGNTVNGDGCQSTCVWTCETNAECSDGNVCNGSETCTLSTHRCAAGTPAADGTTCDRDMNPGTRDICRMASCLASRCGDGYVDAGAMPPEACDDGNLVAGDGCEPTCQPTGAVRPTAFRLITMDLIDPHIFIDFWGCRDVTDTQFLGFAVNSELQSNIDNYTINYVTVHRPLDIVAPMPVMDIYDGTCSMGSTRATCTYDPSMGDVVWPSHANNRPSGMTCLTPDTTTLTAMYPDPNTVTGPCFISDEEEIVINLSGVNIPLHNAHVAATYSGGSPPTTLVSGVIRGWLTEAEARAIILPSSLPLIGGDTLFQHLAAARVRGSSCASHDDRDRRSGVSGFWFYVNFTASLADWTGP